MSVGRRSPGALFVNVLGGFRVAGPRTEDVLVLERRKTRALLAILAVDLGRQVPRERVTAYLWSSQTDDAARHGLRQCLLDLRHALAKAGVDGIRSEGDSLALDPCRVIVDAVRFERLATGNTVDALSEATALYHGDLLEGLRLEDPAFEEWLRLNRERLRSQAIDAMKKLLSHNVRQKAFDHAIQVGIRLLGLEPFDEAIHRTMMALYAETGRRSAALQQYEQCVEVLSRELNTEPEAETRELYRRLVAERSMKTSAISRPKPTSRARRAHGPYRPLAATPLIGREADLAWLDALWQRSQQGTPQLALIVGEAGIGKSRLVGELASRARRRSDEFLLGRGREGEDVLPFAPWVEALRLVLGEPLVGRLPPVTRLDLARLFPEVTDGPGPPPSGLEDGPRIFEAIAHLLRLRAAAQSLVVVIEDLHWCDDMTIRLLRFLTRRLEGKPVFFVGTARPEEIVSGSSRAAVLDVLRRDPACMSNTLAPLDRGQTIELFRIFRTPRAANPSGALADRIWQLSEGNPFVVRECARAMRDRPDAAAGPLIELPDQVRLLTERYLADLDGRAARVAAAAAVIGRDFEVPVICHATGFTKFEVADVLEELVRRRVFREVNGRFDFCHDRVREAAYARLLGSRRSVLHHSVAEALEAVYAPQLDPHCAAIGAHYREAGVWDRASTYLAQAGFQAWERGAGREALACFEDALQAIVRLPDTEERRVLQVHLRLVANGASWATGSFERGLPHLQAAEALARSLNDRRWSGRVATFLCNFHRATGSLDQALPLGHFALDVALETGDRELEFAARLVLAFCVYSTGQYRRSLEHLSPLLTTGVPYPSLKGPHLPWVDTPSSARATTRFLTVNNLTWLGEFDAAKRVVDEMLRECDTAEDPLGTSRLLAQHGLAKLECARGDFPAAVQAREAALTAYREDYHRQWYRPLSWGLGVSYALTGRVAEGLDVIERVDAADRKIGANVFR